MLIGVERWRGDGQGCRLHASALVFSCTITVTVRATIVIVIVIIVIAAMRAAG